MSDEPTGDTTEVRTRTRRDEQRERTREELLDAAATVFANQGYHGASVDQVAEAAGFTKGAVYSNFRSKEELFLELLERQLDRSVEALEAIVSEVAPAARNQALIEQVASLPILQSEWFMLEAEFLLYAARQDDDRVRRRVASRQQRTRARITAVVRRHLDDVGRGDDVDAEDLARLLMATADGLTQAALVDETAGDSGRILSQLLGLILRDLDRSDA